MVSKKVLWVVFNWIGCFALKYGKFTLFPQARICPFLAVRECSYSTDVFREVPRKPRCLIMLLHNSDTFWYSRKNIFCVNIIKNVQYIFMYIIIISTPNFPYFHHFLECIIGTTKLPIDLIVPYLIYSRSCPHWKSRCSTPAMCISHQFDVLPSWPSKVTNLNA